MKRGSPNVTPLWEPTLARFDSFRIVSSLPEWRRRARNSSKGKAVALDLLLSPVEAPLLGAVTGETGLKMIRVVGDWFGLDRPE